MLIARSTFLLWMYWISFIYSDNIFIYVVYVKCNLLEQNQSTGLILVCSELIQVSDVDVDVDVDVKLANSHLTVNPHMGYVLTVALRRTDAFFVDVHDSP